MKDAFAKFRRTAASTVEECKELLQLLLDKYHSEEDSKWVSITEEYGQLASEKKSKQTLKRQAAKLPPSKSVALKPAEPELEQKSNRQKKKEAHAQWAQMEAARKAMADMPEDLDERAVFLSQKFVEYFYESISKGELLTQELEGIFGCKADGGPGLEAYNAWHTIIQHGLIKMEQVVEKLVEGTLPESFGSWLTNFPLTSHSAHTLKLVTNSELLTKLPWDASKLQRCAKQANQAKVLESLAVAATPLIPSADLQAVAEAVEKAGSGPPPEAAQIPGSIEELDKAMKEQKEAAPTGGEGDGYTWTQKDDEIEVVIPVDKAVARKDIKLAIKAKEVVMDAPKSLRLELHSQVDLDGSGWTLTKGQGQVVVTLEKKSAGMWPQLLKR